MTISELIPTQPQRTVSEIIGRVVYVDSLWASRTRVKDVDQTIGDYAFWDKLRRGKLDGYKFAALFCVPITQITAGYVWGDGPTLALVEKPADPENEADPLTYTNTLLSRFMERTSGQLVRMVEDSYALGDQFVIINADGTLSIASPETVEITYDPLDAQTPVAYTITTKTDDLETTDEYRLDGRTVTLKAHKDLSALGMRANDTRVAEFQNLIGRLPVVHFSCDRSANEQRGRPVYEPLLHLLSRYNDLIEKGIDGAEIMGNPIPAFVGLEDVNETIKANSNTTSYTNAEGDPQDRAEFRFDTMSVAWIKGGDFKFVSPPGGWSGDLRDMLKSMFYLLLDATRIPEFLWGGAIASSRASTETQLPPFVQYVGLRRQQIEGEGADELLGASANGGLLELADIWLRTRALIDPRVVVAPVAVHKWPEVAADDETLRFEQIKWAHGVGLVTAKTALEQLDMVDDAQRELEAAQEEAQEAQEQQLEFSTKLAEAEQAAAGEAAQERPAPAERRNGREPVGVAA